MTDSTPDDLTVDAAAPEPDVATPRSVPVDALLAGLVGAFPATAVDERADEDVAHVAATDYAGFVAAARDAGYDVFVDLCGVDYLRRTPRFEVVVNLLSYGRRRRLRIRTGVAGEDPRLPSIVDVFPGANYYERETYDLFGIEFTGHPDLTRILLPDDWEGHPLRKDYSVGSVPVQFKGANKAS